MKPNLTIYHPAKQSGSTHDEIRLDAITAALSVLGFLSAVVFLLTMG